MRLSEIKDHPEMIRDLGIKVLDVLADFTNTMINGFRYLVCWKAKFRERHIFKYRTHSLFLFCECIEITDEKSGIMDIAPELLHLIGSFSLSK